MRSWPVIPCSISSTSNSPSPRPSAFTNRIPPLPLFHCGSPCRTFSTLQFLHPLPLLLSPTLLPLLSPSQSPPSAGTTCPTHICVLLGCAAAGLLLLLLYVVGGDFFFYSFSGSKRDARAKLLLCVDPPVSLCPVCPARQPLARAAVCTARRPLPRLCTINWFHGLWSVCTARHPLPCLIGFTA